MSCRSLARRGVKVGRGVVLLLVVSLCACGPVRVATLKKPESRTPAEQELDGVECSQRSQLSYFPLLFGIGIPISRSIVKGRYADCMEGKGYVVDR